MKRNIILLVILLVALIVATYIFGNRTDSSGNSSEIGYFDPKINISDVQTVKDIYDKVPSTSTSTPYNKIVKTNGEIIFVPKAHQEPVEKNIYTISGKYTTTEKIRPSNWDDNLLEKHICDSFIVLSGDEYLIEKYKQLVKDGNTINRLDAQGRLILNLDLKPLPQDWAIKITSSSQAITLLINEKDMEGRGVEPCYSFVDVQAVQE